MKRGLLATFLLIPIGLMAAGTGGLRGTLKEARQLAAKQNKEIILKFYADW